MLKPYGQFFIFYFLEFLFLATDRLVDCQEMNWWQIQACAMLSKLQCCDHQVAHVEVEMFGDLIVYEFVIDL